MSSNSNLVLLIVVYFYPSTISFLWLLTLCSKIHNPNIRLFAKLLQHLSSFNRTILYFTFLGSICNNVVSLGQSSSDTRNCQFWWNHFWGTCQKYARKVSYVNKIFSKICLQFWCFKMVFILATIFEFLIWIMQLFQRISKTCQFCYWTSRRTRETSSSRWNRHRLWWSHSIYFAGTIQQRTWSDVETNWGKI